MRTIITNLYTFDELTAKAQDAVIQKEIENIELGIENNAFDITAVLDDATTIGKLFGLEIDNILYSGFWSQGDGASFTGRYQFRAAGLEAVKAYAPLDGELHQTVIHLRRSLGQSCKDAVHITQTGRYFHENTMEFDTDNTVIIDGLKEYARWIYKRLEREYEYQTSREYIIELIEGNGDEFYADGRKYND